MDTITLEDFERLDPEHDYAYTFVQHVLVRHGFMQPSASQLADAVGVFNAYATSIGELHEDEPALFWAVWEPALSGQLRAEAYLTWGATRPTTEQWREAFFRVTSSSSFGTTEHQPLLLRTESVQ
jgi:hypothetical protein